MKEKKVTLNQYQAAKGARLASLIVMAIEKLMHWHPGIFHPAFLGMAIYLPIASACVTGKLILDLPTIGSIMFRSASLAATGAPFSGSFATTPSIVAGR
jgi:hypothetical protein